MDFSTIDGIVLDDNERKKLLREFYKKIPRDLIFLAQDLLAKGFPYQQCSAIMGVKESDCRKVIRDWQEFLAEQMSAVAN